jgi:hypothetical protein
MDINEKTNNLENNLEIWPGRFNVIVEYEGYEYLDTLWSVRMLVYSEDQFDDSCKSLIDEGTDPRLTFTEKQADELISFIKTVEGYTAWRLQAYKEKGPLSFIENHYADESKGERLHYLYDEEGYPLDFKAIGFFNLNHAVRIGPVSEKLLWSKIDRMLSPLPYSERDRLLHLALDFAKMHFKEKV